MSNAFRPSTLSRRQVTAGIAAGGGIAATMYRLTQAQTTGTPEAAVETADPSSSESSSKLTDAIARVRETIARVQADRDAVSSDIDAKTVDDLLTQATTLVDDAEANVATGDARTLLQQVRGARGIAGAAQAVIVAELMFAGLPSQANKSVAVLTEAHDQVAALTTVAEADTSTIDLGAITSQAQALYTKAYDLHGTGAFAQAMAYADAAEDLAEAGLTLSGERSANDHGDRRGGKHDRHDESEDNGDSTSTDEVATPPAPEFGA